MIISCILYYFWWFKLHFAATKHHNVFQIEVSNISCNILSFIFLHQLPQGVKSIPVTHWGIIHENSELCHTKEYNVKEELLLMVWIPILVQLLDLFTDNLIKCWKFLFWNEIQEWSRLLMLSSLISEVSVHLPAHWLENLYKSVKQT